MKRILLIAYLIMTVVGVQAAKQYRDFTDTKGRTIRGCIVSYDTKKGIVSFERDNRKISKVPITVFSESDQVYIKDWEVLKCFSLERLFKISAKRRKQDNEGKSSTEHNKKTDVVDTNYEILLENRSKSVFKGLKMEYCIYYEQDGRKEAIQGVYHDDLAIASIKPTSKKVLKTEAVSTYTRELDSNWTYGDGGGNSSGVKNIQRGDVHGIWIRIHMTMPSGEKATREVCFPDNLSNSKAWMNSSIRAGMN